MTAQILYLHPPAPTLLRPAQRAAVNSLRLNGLRAAHGDALAKACLEHLSGSTGETRLAAAAATILRHLNGAGGGNDDLPDGVA